MIHTEYVEHDSSIFQALDRWEAERKSHYSPFERFKSRYPNTRFEDAFPAMQFQGSLAKLMDELEAALKSPSDGANFINIALHPPRIIRAVLDYKIDNPDEEGEELVEKAIDLGLLVYQGNPDAADAQRNLRATLDADGNKQLLDQLVEQAADAPTWHATDPEKSFNTAQTLGYQVEHPEILLIALGHGGVAAGMDVFSYYCAITGATDSQLYALRFSRRKHGDLFPRISEREHDLLKNKARDRQVVVFDEDVVSGDTLEIAADTLSDILSPQSHSIVIANNMRIGDKSEKNIEQPQLINYQKINNREKLISNFNNYKEIFYSFPNY